jgi:hypothetical protein
LSSRFLPWPKETVSTKGCPYALYQKYMT